MFLGAFCQCEMEALEYKYLPVSATKQSCLDFSSLKVLGGGHYRTNKIPSLIRALNRRWAWRRRRTKGSPG
jgi:hypothetical protein